MRNELVKGGKEHGVLRVGTNAGAPSASAQPSPGDPVLRPLLPAAGGGQVWARDDP